MVGKGWMMEDRSSVGRIQTVSGTRPCKGNNYKVIVKEDIPPYCHELRVLFAPHGENFTISVISLNCARPYTLIIPRGLRLSSTRRVQAKSLETLELHFNF